MPPMEISVTAYSETFASIHDHLARGTLANGLPKVTIPVTFLLGEQSPIPIEHGRASAALMPTAEITVVNGSGHVPWLEKPGCVRLELDRLRSRSG